ncbi:hypothetical protein SAMN05421828_112121, partial [Acidiphilium rubrum]
MTTHHTTILVTGLGGTKRITDFHDVYLKLLNRVARLMETRHRSVNPVAFEASKAGGFPSGAIPAMKSIAGTFGSSAPSTPTKETLKKSFTIRFRYDSLGLTERMTLDAAQFC